MEREKRNEGRKEGNEKEGFQIISNPKTSDE